MIFALWILMGIGVVAAIALASDFNLPTDIFDKFPKKAPSMGKSRLVRIEEKVDILDGEVRRAVRMGTDFYEQAKLQLKEEQERCLILEANKNELEARIKILDSERNQQKQTIDSLQQKQKELTSQLNVINKELSAALSKVDKLSNQLMKQKALRGDGEFELEKLREEVEVLRNELEYERNN